MKYDPLKSFGYPVLSPLVPGQAPELADYRKTSFQPSFAFRLKEDDPQFFVVSYDFTGLSLKPLKSLIERSEATFIVRVECRATFFSVTHEVGLEGEFEIDGSMLRDWVDFTGYVVANGIVEIQSDQINEEFGYDTFEIEDGAVLAWAPPTTYSVEKDFYRNIRSIFEYREDAKLEIGQFYIDLEDEYVFIHAHPTQIQYFRNAEATKKNRVLLLSSVFYPVVLQMVIKIQEDTEDVLAKKWGNIFAAKCAAKGIDYTRDPNLVAQAILGKTLKKMSEDNFRN